MQSTKGDNIHRNMHMKTYTNALAHTCTGAHVLYAHMFDGNTCMKDM